MKCVVGCKAYSGKEVHHHKDCPFYPESMSKQLDDLNRENKKLRKTVPLLRSFAELLEIKIPPEINQIEDLVDYLYENIGS